MQLLDWLVVATVGAIVLVLLDGFRRKWVERRNRVVMKLDPNIPKEDIDLDLLPNSELPNGGARTLPRENEPVIPRKRYNLKDGRDRVARQPETTPDSVPVLMDPVDIEESSIEHANVFVSADPVQDQAADHFDDDDLPPEVSAGLEDDYESARAPSTAEVANAAAAAVEERDSMRDPLFDDDDASSDDVDFLPDPAEVEDQLQEQGLMDELADQFVTTHQDPMAESLDDEFNDEFDEEFDDGFDAEAEAAVAAEEAAAAAHNETGGDAAALIGDDQAEEYADGDTEGDEEDEEYDPYDDEHNYENEPALLENAYRLAASHFQRPPPSSEPRIEPGFGEAPADEVEPTDAFASTLDEAGMEAFLDEEQEEIRAWRTQSVTQQAAEAAVERKQHPAAKIEQPAIRTQSAPATPAAPQAVQPPAPKPQKSASKDNKPGFWETVASMGGNKTATSKPVPAKIDQGELFQEESAIEEPTPEPGPQEVIIINVMAKPGTYFYGDELLPVLQHYGLRLGNMNIFHRHTEPNGNGAVMFSMANMVKPGTFTLNSIEDFATPGISFFVQFPNRHGNMKAFELMLATANAIKEAMDGDLKDERRSVLTRQTVEHCRQRVRDFELSLLSKK